MFQTKGDILEMVRTPVWSRLRADRKRSKGSTSSVLKATGQPQQNFYPARLDPDRVEIRIIELLPGHYASKLRLQLETVPLRGAGEYHALSYCWSSYPGTRTISVDDRDGFVVTENLYRALRCLRQRRVRKLWIDAICIDQSDDREKEWQIGLMGSIYGEAYSVKIWIGDSTSAIRSYLTRVMITLSKYAPRSETCLNKLLIKDVQAIISDATNLWWERVWVVQEVALAQKDPDVLSGGIHLPWDRFRVHIPDEGLAAFLQIMNYARQDQALEQNSAANTNGANIFRFFDLILRTTSRDPRDKVFGILALLPEAQRRMMPVSYEETCVQIYTQATAVGILSCGTLDPLAMVFLDGTGRYSSSMDHTCRLAGLPSWALDFTCIESDSNSGLTNPYFPSIQYFPGRLIHAATIDDSDRYIDRYVSWNRTSSPSMCYKAFQDCVEPESVGQQYIRELDSGLLHLGGLVIDHISKILKLPRIHWLTRERPEEEKETHAQYALFSKDLRTFLRTQPVSRPYTHLANQCSWLMNDPNKDMIEWLDMADRIPSLPPKNRHSIDIVWHAFAIWKAMAEHTTLPRIRSPGSKYSLDGLERWGTTSLSVDTYFDVATRQTMLFVTSSGFLGLALDRVEEADRVVLVHGCEYPIVLRQTADDRYTFQGLAYVNGIMDGELLEMITEDPIEHESFVIA